MPATAIRPLVIMLRALGYAALPCWPAGIAAAVWWTGRAELLLLSVAGSGTSAALATLVMDRAAAAARRREGEHARLAAQLCGVIREEMHPRGLAMTLPDLPVVPDLRVVRPAVRRGGAPARR
jgi:hypothetical protein